MEHHSEPKRGFFGTITNTEGSGIFAFFYIILVVLFLAWIVFQV